MLLRFFYSNSRNSTNIPFLSPCVKLSLALCMTAAKLKMKTPGAGMSSAVPQGCWNKMSQ